jgi:hypothetical protein
MTEATKKRLLVTGVGVVAAAIATVIILAASPTKKGQQYDPGSQVKIELRGKPVAKLKMNGKSIGKTPMTIVVAKGTQPIELEAMFTINKIAFGGDPKKAKKTEVFRQVKTVVPDGEQAVDFNINDATKVDTSVGPMGSGATAGSERP